MCVSRSCTHVLRSSVSRTRMHTRQTHPSGELPTMLQGGTTSLVYMPERERRQPRPPPSITTFQPGSTMDNGRTSHSTHTPLHGGCHPHAATSKTPRETTHGMPLPHQPSLSHPGERESGRPRPRGHCQSKDESIRLIGRIRQPYGVGYTATRH